MKHLKKSALLLALSAIFALNNAQAQAQTQTNKQTAAQQQKKNQKNSKQQKQKKKETEKKENNKASSEDKALEQFNAAFGIQFIGYKFTQGENNKPYLVLRYDLSNKSNKDVHLVQFIGAFAYNNQIIYAREIPLTFNDPLKAKNTISLDISIPAEQVPETALQLFNAHNTEIKPINGAQLLTFTDKTSIEVK